MHARTARPNVVANNEPLPLAIAQRCKRGFTLVELLVALVLLDCALLALAGTLAQVSREIAAATAKSRALTAAHARIARLAASSCGALTSGAYEGPPPEWWTDRPTAFGTRVLIDSVEYLVRGARRAVVIHTRTPC